MLLARGKTVVQIVAAISVTLVFNTSTEKRPELFLNSIAKNSEWFEEMYHTDHQDYSQP